MGAAGPFVISAVVAVASIALGIIPPDEGLPLVSSNGQLWLDAPKRLAKRAVGRRVLSDVRRFGQAVGGVAGSTPRKRKSYNRTRSSKAAGAHLMAGDMRAVLNEADVIEFDAISESETDDSAQEQDWRLWWRPIGRCWRPCGG